MTRNCNNKNNTEENKRCCRHFRKSKKLSPAAQQLILECAAVDKIKTQVDYANSFLLRSFRLSLQMEEG
jgi:hypothetical protein